VAIANSVVYFACYIEDHFEGRGLVESNDWRFSTDERRDARKELLFPHLGRSLQEFATCLESIPTG
jgi:hypothetical protein